VNDSIGRLNDTAFYRDLCSGAWLKMLCAMVLEQEGQELKEEDSTLAVDTATYKRACSWKA
jgi:hypothetical protein